MQKILVTGATGFVGSRFIQRWGGVYNILAPTHSEMDVIDKISVENYFRNNRPDVVLHLAAISNTMHCEQNSNDSYAVNVVGTANIAQAASSCGAKIIFFSSDQVYNGNSETGLHDENIPLAPENVYGRHKLEAEQIISEIAPDAVILRATWMYDDDKNNLPIHNNFVVNIMRAVAEHTPITFPIHEYRGITWVREVVELLPYTFNLSGGIYNYGSENRLNTYETACCFLEMIETDVKTENIVHPDIERFSQRERNISISTNKILRASGYNICFSSTLDGLRIFLENR